MHTHAHTCTQCVRVCVCVCVCRLIEACACWGRAQAVDFSAASASSSSGRGSLLASVGGDRICRIWDVETGTTLRLLKSTGALITVRFSPDANTVAAGGLRGALGLWDVSSGKLLGGRPHPVLLHSHASVSSITWTPDSRAIVVCGTDGIVWAWDVLVGRLQAARSMTTGHHCQEDVTAASAVFFPPAFLQAARQKAAAAARRAPPGAHQPASDEDVNACGPLAQGANIKTPTGRFLSTHWGIESRTPEKHRSEAKAGVGHAEAACTAASTPGSPFVVLADNKGRVHMLQAEGLEASPSAFEFRAGAHMHFQAHHASHRVQTRHDSSHTMIQMIKDSDQASFLNEATERHRRVRQTMLSMGAIGRAGGVAFERGKEVGYTKTPLDRAEVPSCPSCRSFLSASCLSFLSCLSVLLVSSVCRPLALSRVVACVWASRILRPLHLLLV